MAPTSARVVVIGDALIDELRDDGGVREFVGGAALNVAVGLARLGVPTSLIAMVGDDEAGSHIRSYLSVFGVELLATPSPLGSSRAVSVRAHGGEPVYEFNEAAQARRIRFGPAERSAIAAAPVTVISCFPFDDADQTDDLAAALEYCSGKIVVDPNPRAGMMSDRDGFVRGFERIAARADLVKVGDDDAALLYGESLDALRGRLRDRGARIVLATKGAAGADLDTGEDVVSLPVPSLPGPIIDTMGAGDASLAATVAGLVEGTPEDVDGWRALLQTAMDVAAATCRFEGALLRLPSALQSEDLDRLGT